VHEHKGSRFNIAVPVEDGDVLLYNTATGGLVRVDEDTYAAVQPLFRAGGRDVPRDWAPAVPGELDPDVARVLAAGGFIVARELDEVAALRDAFERERNNPNLKFTIGLTMACNFACPYCFEEHRNEHMTPPVADAVFRFVQQHMRDAGARSVYVNWFGGEPLLNVDVLCRLSAQIRREAGATGAHYESMVITNGALLTRDVAERLRAAGVEAVQVTIDGPAEVHDRRRPFKGGQPSFARIVANIRATQDLLRTTIRVNVDQGNRAAQPALVRALAAQGILDGPHAARLYAGKVTRYTEQSEMLWAPLDQRAIAQLGDPIAGELTRLGLPVLAAGSPLDWAGDRGGCSAMRNHSFVIGPSGQLFKCELGIHDDREALGAVGPLADARDPSAPAASASAAPASAAAAPASAAAAPASAAAAPARKPRRLPVLGSAFGSRSLDWSGHNPYDSARCSGCQFVPLCKGGCPKRVMERDLGFMQETCDYWDHNYQRLIRDLAAPPAASS
jgi:uncharacterized protein